MARKADNITVKWDENDEQLAALIAKHYAGEMGILGFATRSATRPGGEESFNRSGVIKFALTKLALAIKENQSDA